MIPHTECELWYSLPDHELWIPGREELSSDEGFGPYRDTWIITRVGIRDAKRLVSDEGEIVACISNLANSESDFDALASAVECGDPEALAGIDCTVPEDSRLHHFFNEGWSATGGLDLGVAGLVYALAAVGCFPEVSCRGHPGDRAWSSSPVVKFAARHWRAELLLPIARQAKCGMAYNERTVEVWASSILSMMDMANLVLDSRDSLKRNPAAPLRHSRTSADGVQLQLDLTGTNAIH